MNEFIFLANLFVQHVLFLFQMLMLFLALFLFIFMLFDFLNQIIEVFLGEKDWLDKVIRANTWFFLKNYYKNTKI